MEAPPASGIKRRVTTARLRPHWLLVSTSVGTSSQSDKPRAPSLTLMKCRMSSKCPEHCRIMWKNDTNLIYNPWEIFHHEWQRHHAKMDAPPQIHFRTNPENQQQKLLQAESRAPRKNRTLKHKKPHDATFMFRRALNTSLWEIWMATVLSLTQS